MTSLSSFFSIYNSQANFGNFCDELNFVINLYYEYKFFCKALWQKDN
jgi:hypothetical protein